MKSDTQSKKAYLVIVWDKADDSFYDIVTLASSDGQAMHQAWVERLDASQIPEEDREEEFSEDGGKAGFTPVMAITKSFLAEMFAALEDTPLAES